MLTLSKMISPKKKLFWSVCMTLYTVQQQQKLCLTKPTNYQGLGETGGGGQTLQNNNTHYRQIKKTVFLKKNYHFNLFWCFFFLLWEGDSQIEPL